MINFLLDDVSESMNLVSSTLRNIFYVSVFHRFLRYINKDRLLLSTANGFRISFRNSLQITQKNKGSDFGEEPEEIPNITD